MSLSEELPLYKDTLNLLNLTLEKTKSYRYTLGEKMVSINLEMLSLIYEANSSYDKIPILNEFINKYHMLIMLFRVCVEQHVINERQYANVALLLQKIGKQATGWKLEKSIRKAVKNDTVNFI